MEMTGEIQPGWIEAFAVDKNYLSKAQGMLGGLPFVNCSSIILPIVKNCSAIILPFVNCSAITLPL
eukprot:2377884-Pyramimonas_sp.AAC.1